MTLSQHILQQKLNRQFRFRQSADSSNELAKSWLLDGAAEGAVVVVDEQRKGRGRHGRSWHTPPGAALALSVILKPAAADVAFVNMVGALSVFDLVRQIGCQGASIKWPNDVQIRGKKVSGILAENIWERTKLIGVVLGIGVNVRVDFRDTDLADTAISLEDITPRRHDRAELLCQLLDHIDSWYRAAPADIFASWKSRLSTLGKRIYLAGTPAVALDVTSAGALIVKCESGEVREVNAGDVFEIGSRGSGQ